MLLDHSQQQSILQASLDIISELAITAGILLHSSILFLPHCNCCSHHHVAITTTTTTTTTTANYCYYSYYTTITSTSASSGILDMLKQCDIITSMLCRYTVPLWHGQELCTVLKGDAPGESRNLTLQWRHYHALVKVRL